MIVGLIAVSGCTATSGTPVAGDPSAVQRAQGPDISAAGRLDYACALAIDASTNSGPVESWDITVGDEADPVQPQMAGAVGLLGAVTSSQVAEHPTLSESASTYYQGAARVDPPTMQQGLDGLVAGCRDAGLPAQAPDISSGGQVDYACALVTDVATKRGPVDDWLAIGDDAGPAVYELGGAVGLLGAMSATHLAGHRDLSTAAMDVLGGLSRLDVPAIEQGIDDLAQGCSDR